MSTSNELETVDMIELSCNLVSEKPASTTRRDSPRFNVLRITPNQVAESALMRNFLGPSNNTNLIDGTNLRAQTTVYAEDFTINNSSKDEEVEHLATRFPDRCITILLLALLIETIDLGYLAGLVVASNESNLVRVPLNG
jgi:hypothetical protein